MPFNISRFLSLLGLLDPWFSLSLREDKFSQSNEFLWARKIFTHHTNTLTPPNPCLKHLISNLFSQSVLTYVSHKFGFTLFYIKLSVSDSTWVQPPSVMQVWCSVINQTYLTVQMVSLEACVPHGHLGIDLKCKFMDNEYREQVNGWPCLFGCVALLTWTVATTLVELCVNCNKSCDEQKSLTLARMTGARK